MIFQSRQTAVSWQSRGRSKKKPPAPNRSEATNDGSRSYVDRKDSRAGTHAEEVNETDTLKNPIAAGTRLVSRGDTKQ